MALPFLGKKPAVTGKGYVPADRIRELASKGFSEPELIDILRKEGFSPEEVDKGLTQALKVSVYPEGQAAAAPQQQPQPISQFARPTEPTRELPALPELPTLEQLQQQEKAAAPTAPAETFEVPETSLPQGYYESYTTEEYLDYLITVRMEEVNNRIADLSKRHDDTKKELEELRSRMAEQEKTKKQDIDTIVSKFDEAKSMTSDFGSRVASMERVFRETIPGLVEGVKTLADLVEKARKQQAAA